MNETQRAVQEPSPQTLRAFLAAPVSCTEAPEASTVGELFAAIVLSEWQTASPFAGPKIAVYLAAVRAGLITGVADGDKICQVDVTAAETLAQAAILAIGKPADLTTAAALRAMISAKRQAVADAGISRGLSPDWLVPTFTAEEIEAALTGTGA